MTNKSELKRLCAQNPVEMAERIVELEQQVKVLTDALRIIMDDQHAEENRYVFLTAKQALDATPQQTAEQIERWHVEWMKTLPVAGVIEQSNFGNPQQVYLVAIPQLPETKEPTK